MSLVGYFKRDRRRTRCPECGRDLTVSVDGTRRFCAYAEYHKDGVPLFERSELLRVARTGEETDG